jgi:NAD(P)-dependent dehydrogenase (short-subunit alcohol dehydrogenase family)
VKGKTVLITGGNTGIGLETAAGLAQMGAEVIITSRDMAKGAAAVEEIRQRQANANVTVTRLDVLVNNAGLILSERSETEDGFESTFQINHLGPFLLTNLLLDKLKASAPSRIVNVASTAHRGATLDFDDLQNEHGHGAMRAYGKSKLCNILFTRELARRLKGSGVTANSLHPGTVRTNFGRDGDVGGLFAIGVKLGGIFFKSPAQGARTSIYVASSDEAGAVSGEYWVNRKMGKPSAAARDDEAARRLWEKSAELLKL